MKPVVVLFLQLSLLKYEYSYIYLNIYLNAQRISDSWEAGPLNHMKSKTRSLWIPLNSSVKFTERIQLRGSSRQVWPRVINSLSDTRSIDPSKWENEF